MRVKELAFTPTLTSQNAEDMWQESKGKVQLTARVEIDKFRASWINPVYNRLETSSLIGSSEEFRFNGLFICMDGTVPYHARRLASLSHKEAALIKRSSASAAMAKVITETVQLTPLAE